VGTITERAGTDQVIDPGSGAGPIVVATADETKEW
jgi:hypothetical protein